MLKRILLISIHGDPIAPLGSTQSGGQNNYVKQLMYSLSKKGYQVDVLTHWSDPSDAQIEVVSSNLRVFRFSARELEFVPKSEMYYLLRRFYNEVKAEFDLETYDIIHTNYWLSGTLGYLIKKDFKLPWVHTSHSLGLVKTKFTGDVDELRVHCERQILNAVDSIIATTYNEKNTLLKDYSSIKNIKVIPVGVDESLFLKSNIPAPKEAYFLFVGRLEKTKGIDILINAFKMMHEYISDDIKLIIVGGGGKKENEFSIPDYVKVNIKGIEDKIIFTGGLPQEKLGSLFSGALATIVPSYYESFGMVAAESQAVGTPVLATRVGGLQEVVQDKKTGFLFENKDSKELAKLMVKIYENVHLRKKLGKQAKHFAIDNFVWSNITNKTITLYKETININEAYLPSSN